MVLVVQPFFSTGCLPNDRNITALTLVPKIGCLSIRFQSVQPLLISESQSAFVKDRSIADNILLMQELVRDNHRGNPPHGCAIKIDLMKAYDSVDWSFLFEIMGAMDFPQQFIGRV